MFRSIAAALAMSLLSVGPGYSKPITPVTKVTQYKDVEGTWGLVGSDGFVETDAAKTLSLMYSRHRYILHYGEVFCDDITGKFSHVKRNLVCDFNSNGTSGVYTTTSGVYLTIRYIEANTIYVALGIENEFDGETTVHFQGVFIKLSNDPE